MSFLELQKVVQVKKVCLEPFELNKSPGNAGCITR